MDIRDQFRVPVPVAEAWTVLLDVERIAPCMPGAQLQEIEGDEFRGIVKVKVGPITAQYKGVASILEADEAAHRLVLKAEGRDTRGQGNASANVTVVLSPDGEGTLVEIETDLTVSGKVAQFGRGVMADVSAKLLAQFAECLQSKVAAGELGGAAVTAPVAGTPGGARTIEAPEVEAVDLMKAAGGAVMKRLVPTVVVAAVVVGLAVWLVSR